MAAAFSEAQRKRFYRRNKLCEYLKKIFNLKKREIIMKYLDVLTEKNLTVTDLSVGLQKKIAALNKTAAKLDDDFKNTEEGSQVRIDVSAEIEKLSFVDAGLASKIQKFDKDAYANKLQLINSMNENKRANKVSDVKEEPDEEEKVAPAKVIPIANAKVKESINELRDKAERLMRIQQQSNLMPDPIVGLTQQLPEEIFHKTGNANPSKTNFWLIVLGVGASILTFGAYKVLKSRT
jgi:hypothetical protein